MRIIAAQIGSRRNYSVPLAFARARVLERFYTDFATTPAWAQLLEPLARRASLPALIKKAIRRRLPNELTSRTTTFPGVSLRHEIRRRYAQNASTASLMFSTELGAAMAREGLGRATHVYSMLVECWPLMKAARERGVITVAEVYIDLRSNNIVREEAELFPGWSEFEPPANSADDPHPSGDPLFDHADYFIVPAEQVAQDLILRFEIPRNRVSVVPYPVPDPGLLRFHNSPQTGRVLFGGSATLRKGIHYLAMAASHLPAPKYEFRIAGDSSDKVRANPLARRLTFLGRIPWSNMAREMQWADVMVLPTLAEGSAQVILEAMSVGVPVITTEAAGSPITHMEDGILASPRDSRALAAAIEEVVTNRTLRRRLSEAAKETASTFTLEKYSRDLMNAATTWRPLSN